ncbi:MAG: DNA polymerase III subunit beta [Vampirovibrionales bacterium]|nr:DNA polymerase III subunit beta [Vampirovibrionales bacterium]
MQLTVDRDTLFQALGATSRATASRVIQPILANVLLATTTDNQLQLTGTDLDFTIQTHIPLESVTTQGTTTLPAKKLAEIFAKLPSGQPVSITVDSATQNATLRSGKSVFELKAMPADDFPTTPEVTTLGTSFQVGLPALLQGIQQTAFAAANFETNNVLGGVFVKLSSGMLEMAATDGSRLARAMEAFTGSTSVEEISAVIPVRVLQDVAKLCGSNVATDAMVTITLNDRQIAFQTPQFLVVSRLLEGQYPQYQQLIPATNKIIVRAKRKSLMESLDRTAVMANERTNVVKMMFDPDSQELRLEANTPDQGGSQDSMPVEFSDAEPLHIAFNYKFLLDALKVIESDDIRMETNGALAPTVFKDGIKDNYLCLVMPVQVK